MARYPNGRIPESELIKLGPEHYSTPATARRIANLVDDIRRNEGFTLEVTGGPNIYRDLEWQKFYWDVLPYPQAAYPGTSSHGGEYQGRDAIAVDFNNWAILPKKKWYEYAEKHGFTTNIFSWEPWHVVDFNPWSMPAGAGDVDPIIEELRENMDTAKIIHKVEGGVTTYALISATYPGGYRTTQAMTTANAWAVLYGPSSLRTNFDTVLAEIRAINTAWVVQQKQIHGVA